MKCPKCGSTNTIVVDSRPNADETRKRRRHKCRQCGYRYTTCEIYQETYDELSERFMEDNTKLRRMLKLMVEVME